MPTKQQVFLLKKNDIFIKKLLKKLKAVTGWLWSGYPQKLWKANNQQPPVDNLVINFVYLV